MKNEDKILFTGLAFTLFGLILYRIWKIEPKKTLGYVPLMVNPEEVKPPQKKVKAPIRKTIVIEDDNPDNYTTMARAQLLASLNK